MSGSAPGSDGDRARTPAKRPRAPIVLSIVIPVYNNADCLDELVRRLGRVLEPLPLREHELVFVDDASRDASLEILRGWAAADSHVRVLALSRNFGQQRALAAGLDVSRGDVVIVMDADLQDPPEFIPDFLDKWWDGYDVVHGVRLTRAGESWLKRRMAEAFYRLLRRLTATAIAVDAGEFRLLSRRAVDSVARMPERTRLLRGMVGWIGFPQATVSFHRAPRWAGESQYSLRKLLRLATDAVVAFSDLPLRVATWLGFGGAAVSFAYLIYAVAQKIFGGVPVRGWTSLIAVVTFIGSVQLIVLGIIGEYLGRMHEEVKGRPLYIVSERIGFDGVDGDARGGT